MRIVLHHPGDGFYMGTRFDRGGVFDSLEACGTELCGRWFTSYDPLMHDAVCGPAEEFSPIKGPEEGTILKIGVGLLKDDGAPYDRFKLYEIIRPGSWSMENTGGSIVFRHTLEGFYDYRKEIALTGESAFEIRHSLTACVPVEGEVYNHNFFTLGRMAVGPDRLIDLPFTPDGAWRAKYDSVGFTGSGVRFNRALAPGESVYTGNIHKAGEEGMPYDITLREGRFAVHIRGDVPVSRTVLWANHRIACMEPYNNLSIRAGETFFWNIKYDITIL
ncbi:MAG: hypothetical protein IJ151_02840 [Bacteroidales bacterium]|nr:hypothetical protein [Bacteroidales bacterium]